MLPCFGNNLPIHRECIVLSHILNIWKYLSFGFSFVFVFLFSVLTCYKIWVVETVSYLEIWTEWPWDGNVCNWLCWRSLRRKAIEEIKWKSDMWSPQGYFGALWKSNYFVFFTDLFLYWENEFFFPLNHINY